MFHCISLIFIGLLANNARSSGVTPLLKLNDGREIPTFGLGTWLGFTKSGELAKVQGDEVEKAVEWAIDAGYRHIDTAYIYNTEQLVGRAVNKKIASGILTREDLYITTKTDRLVARNKNDLWNTFHAKGDVVSALNKSLCALGLDYVDLYLIHWPIAEYENKTLSDTDYLETWQGMIEAHNQGLAKSIGVSNFNQHQLDRLVSLSSVKPAVLQVEINLNLQQPALLAYCRSQSIAVTGYTPFGSLFEGRAAPDAPPPRADDHALRAIANKYNKTVAQVALRYIVELGVIPIPKSITKSRIEQNIAVFDFQLTQRERDQLRSYDKNYRTIPVRQWIDSPYYPFEKN